MRPAGSSQGCHTLRRDAEMQAGAGLGSWQSPHWLELGWLGVLGGVEVCGGFSPVSLASLTSLSSSSKDTGDSGQLQRQRQECLGQGNTAMQESLEVTPCDMLHMEKARFPRQWPGCAQQPRGMGLFHYTHIWPQGCRTSRTLWEGEWVCGETKPPPCPPQPQAGEEAGRHHCRERDFSCFPGGDRHGQSWALKDSC